MVKRLALVWSRLWTLGSGLRLRTKLVVIMASLLLLSISAASLLHLYTQRKLISKVAEYTEELSTAIDITQEQPPSEGDRTAILGAYVEKLRQLGVKDVSIADEDAVQVSTNPAIVGRKIVTRTRRGPRQVVIKGVLGEESNPPGSRRTSNLVVPIVVGDRRVGYVVITRYLDDFSELSEINLAVQILATLGIFALGMGASLLLAWSLSRPLQQLTHAARRVAGGDLSVQVPTESGGEVASLARTFNEMVVSLRQKQELEEQLRFAERATELGRLASAVAHEIRNPLNFVTLSIDHVRERLGPEDEVRRADFLRVLTTMKAEIARLNRLVGDFLSFGRPIRMHRRLASVEAIVRDVAALVEHKARDQSIELMIEADPALPEMVVDPELLKTCFLNLMINAADAMPAGGRLSVTLRREAGGAGDALLIDVHDTGKGMTPEETRAAFEPYFSTKETGVGLGLAMTRKIVEDHGGSIAIESQPGCGTSVRIVLPLAAASTSPDAEGVAAA